MEQHFANLDKPKIDALLAVLKNNQHLLSQQKVTAGFDGFIDTIASVIKTKEDGQQPVMFGNINEFGNYIVAKNGSSFSLELQQKTVKAGGNMPILSNALGNMGIKVNCIGAFGYPQIHSVFKQLSPLCSMYSFAEPGMCTAYEFQDGKIMMASMDSLNNTGWENVKEIIGLEKIIQLFKESSLLCMVNWSEIDTATDIWTGILTEVVTKHSSSKKQTAFFDLSDFSKRSHAAVKKALDLIKIFSSYCNVIVSLNRNEASLLYKILCNNSTTDLTIAGNEIFAVLQPELLIIHSSKETIAFTKDELYKVASFFTESPVISTGAGDNFNAGFCAACLLQLDAELSVILASAVSGCYIRSGISPSINDIIHFLENLPGNYGT